MWNIIQSEFFVNALLLLRLYYEIRLIILLFIISVWSSNGALCGSRLIRKIVEAVNLITCAAHGYWKYIGTVLKVINSFHIKRHLDTKSHFQACGWLINLI